MSVRAETIAAIRFGYGFHPEQSPPESASALMRSLDAAQDAPLIHPPKDLQSRVELIRKARETRRDGDMEAVRAMRRTMRHTAIQEGLERVMQRVLSPHGFYERLAAFWVNHFAIARKTAQNLSVLPMFEPDAIRPHVMGRFSGMLTAVVQNPMMLSYLDQHVSFGPNSRQGKRRGRGLNENLAREVLELHTLGAGAAYTQADVREFAELLTGYTLHPPTLSFRFIADRAEPGAETVLGRRYGGDTPSPEDAEALLADLATHEATADHLARKLAVHFVSDTPDPDLVRHVARAWRRSKGFLPEVYAALLEHPSAWEGFGAKVKRPVDLVISTFRALGLTKAQVDGYDTREGFRLFRVLRDMNQEPYNPPGPDGWPEEAEAWITPQGLAARLTFASQIAQKAAKRSDLDPRVFAKTALRDAMSDSTRFAVGAAEDRWEGIALAIASPEFNRR